MSFGSSGAVTFFRKSPSFQGEDALNLSLSFCGLTTSLTSGLPSRETWVQSPWASLRWVVDQMPTTGWSADLRSAFVGTCRAMELTL